MRHKAQYDRMAMPTIEEILLSGVFLCVTYCIGLLIYRLVFHPLAAFPGPKLAAATLWYEFYYDVVIGGQWVFKIKSMHDTYGPIVRINPYEIHILDADFYQELYAKQGERRNKYQWWVNFAAAPGSAFATVDHDLHRLRRAPMNDFFSKKAIVQVESLIVERVEKLGSRFVEAVRAEEVIRADCAFMAVTVDVISNYCFGFDRAYLERRDFGLEWKQIISAAWETGALGRAFPWIAPIMQKCPRSLAHKLDSNMGAMFKWQDDVEAAVRPILEYRDGIGKDERTIIHTLRDSNLPLEQKSLRRLCDESIILVGAGSETTAKVLGVILYYLVVNPGITAQLKDELREAMPDPNFLSSWTKLERLPYLSAVIQEGIRLSYGITTRLPRIAFKPIVYQSWTIPTGTPISETPYFVLMDPVIYPEPELFKPERWLEDGHSLNRYMVGFGKGSRQCIGMNLAYAEMFLTCAMLFRRFRFELFDTSFKDMQMVHDFFVAAPAKPYRGIKVRIFPDL